MQDPKVIGGTISKERESRQIQTAKSTKVPEVRGRSTGQGECRVDEALLALSHVLNFGGSWDKAQGWGQGFFTCQGSLGTAMWH